MKTFSQESELRAIASICDGSDVVRATLQAILTEQHFAGEETSELYVRLGSFGHQNRPIPNLKTLRLDPALTDNARDMLDVNVAVASNREDAQALADQLEQYRKLRVIYNGARDVVDSIREPNPKSIQKAIDALEGVIIGARSQYEAASLVTAGRGENAESVVSRVLDQTKPDRIITGFRRFDEASGGFARKDLVLVAATTGGGKSVMANQLGINAYLRQNRNVALVSFEMDEEEIYARLLAAMTDIDFGKIYLRRLSIKQVLRCRRAWETFTEHGKRNGCRFSIWCPSFEVTPAAVGAMLKPGKFDEILIDYVGLVDSGENKALWENLGVITRGFKTIARNQDNVVIVMAQLDEETNKVKYSKAMRHHSSYVWKWKYEEEEAETGEVTIEMDKSRHCQRFNFELYANFSIMSFHDKDGSETSRQLIDRLSSEYGVEDINPDTGEVTDSSQDSTVDESNKPASTDQGNALVYRSLLDAQLSSVTLSFDEDDL